MAALRSERSLGEILGQRLAAYQQEQQREADGCRDERGEMHIVASAHWWNSKFDPRYRL